MIHDGDPSLLVAVEHRLVELQSHLVLQRCQDYPRTHCDIVILTSSSGLTFHSVALLDMSRPMASPSGYSRLYLWGSRKSLLAISVP